MPFFRLGTGGTNKGRGFTAVGDVGGTAPLGEFWRDPVVNATEVYDPAYYDWETSVTSGQTLNMDRGQIVDPLDHPHCPQAVTDGWASRVEITTAQTPNTVINANPQGTVFVLKAGTHQDRHITALRAGDILVGESGAVLDGSGVTGSSADSCRAIYSEVGAGAIVYNVKVENYPLYDNSTDVPPGEAILVRGGRLINCEVNDCGNIAIKMEGPDTIVRWCVVRRAGRLAYAGGTWWETYPHADLEGYRLEYCESDTAHVDDAFDQAWEAAHKWVRVTGMKVRFNYFHDMRGYGIWFDGTVNTATVEYNVCVGGERSGIHYEIANTGTIRYNTIEECGGPGAIYISNSNDCNVHHNYLRWNNSGLWVTDEGSRSPAGRNNELHHNIVYQELVTTGAGNWPNGKASTHYGNSTDGHLPGTVGNVWHHNTYYIDDGAAGANLTSSELFMWLPSNKSGDDGEMNFTSWSALAGESGSTIEFAEKPAVLFDTFTDTDGTDLLSHTPDEGDWTNDQSTWQIHGNKLVPQGGFRHAWVDVGGTEATIEATVNLGADGNTRQAGLSIRFVDGNNLWYVLISRAGDGSWSSCTLQRVESGSWNQVEVGSTSIAASTDYVLRAEVVGNTLSVFLDDVPQFTHDISAVYSTSTLFGVSVGANTDVVVTFDDVTVEM